VRFGLPQRWKGPVPPHGTHIFPFRSSWCWVSLGPENQPYQRREYEDQKIQLPWSYFDSHFDASLLPDEVDLTAPYVFLPLIQQNTEVRETRPVTHHNQNLAPNPSFSLGPPNANMVGKKSGRALQLEEGTRN